MKRESERWPPVKGSGGVKKKGKRKTFRYGRMRLAERLQPLTYGRDKRDFFFSRSSFFDEVFPLRIVCIADSVISHVTGVVSSSPAGQSHLRSHLAICYSIPILFPFFFNDFYFSLSFAVGILDPCRGRMQQTF